MQKEPKKSKQEITPVEVKGDEKEAEKLPDDEQKKKQEEHQKEKQEEPQKEKQEEPQNEKQEEQPKQKGQKDGNDVAEWPIEEQNKKDKVKFY